MGIENDFNSLQQFAAFNQQLFHQNDIKLEQQNSSFFQLLEMTNTDLQPELSPSSSNSSYSDTPMRVSRPPNAYLLFNKEQRKILKDQDPTMKVADISKEIGLRWKSMPKETKDVYIQQANQLKEEKKALYPNAMYMRRSRAELIKAGRSHSPTPMKRKKAKKQKDPKIPKHPLSAYMWYLTEVRPDVLRTYPGSNVGQISKLCAARWNAMNDEQKLPWSTKAQADKSRYAREMQIYASQHEKALGRGTRQKYCSAQQPDDSIFNQSFL